MSYVTVMPASNNRRGWMTAHRVGDMIIHTRLDAPAASAPSARAEAAEMFPDARVVMPDDEFKPWLHRDIGIAEHGARKGVVFARCLCGWNGPARRSDDKAVGDLNAHLNPPEERC